MRIAAWRCSDLQRASPLIRRNLKPIGFDRTRFLPSARLMPLPGAPAKPSGVKIALLRYTKGNDGRLFVTPGCSSFEEIEGQINSLQDELDELRDRARRAFQVT